MTMFVAQSSSQESLVPSDTHLVLLCLDYLRDLRRTHDEVALKGKKNINADYISLAVYALSRSILRPEYLANLSPPSENIFRSVTGSAKNHEIPNISKINQEIYASNENNPRPYDMDYDDLHPSNLYRFYKLKGLGSGPDHGPLFLGDLVAAGLEATSSRCRLDAEKEIIRNPAFEKYIQIVSARGYFNDDENSGKRKDPKEEELRRARKAHAYKDKYRKAIAKYREKLAVDVRMDGDTDVLRVSPPCSPPGETLTTLPRRRSPGRDNPSSFNSPPRSLCRENVPPLSPLTPNTAVAEDSRPKTPPTPKGAPRGAPIRRHLSSLIDVRKSNARPTSPPAKPASSSSSSPLGKLDAPTQPASIPKKKSTSPPRGKLLEAPTMQPSSIIEIKSGVSGVSENTKSSAKSHRSPLDVVNRDRLRRSRRKNLSKNQDQPASSSPPPKPERQQQGTTTFPNFPKDPEQDHQPASSSPPKQDRKQQETTTRQHPEQQGQPASSSPPKQERPPQTTTTTPASSSPPKQERPPQATTTFQYPKKHMTGEECQKSPEPRECTSSSSKDDSFESPTVDISVKPEPPIKLKTYYEMNLVSSSSSGLEVNAGSFASPSPTSYQQRRRKSEYEKKLEEGRRWKCPPSLVIPDICDSQKPVSRSPQMANTGGQEPRGALKEPTTPKNSIGNRNALFDKSDHHSGSRGCKSPVARIRHAKKSEELNRLRYGEPEFQQQHEEVTPVSSPRRVKRLTSGDTAWISSECSPFQLPNRPRNGATQSQNRDEAKEIEKQSFAMKRSTFVAASKKNNANISATTGTTNNNKFASGRMPTNSPKGVLKLDPFRFTPPKCFGTLGAGASSRLVPARSGSWDGGAGATKSGSWDEAAGAVPPNNTATIAARLCPSPSQFRSSSRGGRARISPRVLCPSPGGFRGSPRGLQHSPRNFDPSHLKRAC